MGQQVLNNEFQTTSSKQQVPNNKFQTTSSKQQVPNNKLQTTSSKQQAPNNNFYTTSSKQQVLQVQYYQAICISLKKILYHIYKFCKIKCVAVNCCTYDVAIATSALPIACINHAWKSKLSINKSISCFKKNVTRKHSSSALLEKNHLKIDKQIISKNRIILLKLVTIQRT